MQNLGFAFSLLPLVGRLSTKDQAAAFLSRHLLLFNTHPYLAGAIIGSIAHMERTEADEEGKDREIGSVKNALMGPYAAMGDSFFWGALKPLAAVFSVLLALQKSLLAPFAFLLVFDPVHLWIRAGGFMEGYRRGKAGIDFIRRLDLPRHTALVRWISLMGLGCVAAVLSHFDHIRTPGFPILVMTKGFFLCMVLLCSWGMKKGISQVTMLYSLFIVSCFLSL